MASSESDFPRYRDPSPTSSETSRRKVGQQDFSIYSYSHSAYLDNGGTPFPVCRPAPKVGLSSSNPASPPPP